MLLHINILNVLGPTVVTGWNVNGKLSSLAYVLLLVTVCCQICKVNKRVTEITELGCVDTIIGNFSKKVPLCSSNFLNNYVQ